MPAGTVAARARSHHVQNGRSDARGVDATRAASAPHRDGTTARRHDDPTGSAAVQASNATVPATSRASAHARPTRAPSACRGAGGIAAGDPYRHSYRHSADLTVLFRDRPWLSVSNLIGCGTTVETYADGHARIPPLSRGSSGRRFKSCQPDNEKWALSCDNRANLLTGSMRRRQPVGPAGGWPLTQWTRAGEHWADRPHVMHAMRACTRCAALAKAGVQVPKLTTGQVGWWHASPISVVRGSGNRILRLSLCGGLCPAPFGDRLARFASRRRTTFWVVLGMAEGFSSRRAPYAPMLLPQDSQYSAAPGWRAGRSR